MEPSHPAIHYQKLQISDSEEGEQDVTVTMHLPRPSARKIIHQKQKETCCRICAALLLLAIALSFLFFEILYGSLGQSQGQTEVLEDWNSTKEGQLESHLHGEEEEEGGGHVHEHGVYHHATVITESEICSSLGKDVLMAGGNVIDAGVSATLCLGIVHPHTAGIGGAFSAIFHNATSGITIALNAVPTLSLALKYGVPLTLQGLYLLHQYHGQLGWSELLEPIVQLARGGFRIDHILARALRENEERVKSSLLCSLFCYANGSLKDEGSLVVSPKLGDILHEAGSMMAEATLPEELVKYLIQDLPPQEGELLSDAISRSKVALENPLDFKLDGFTLYSAPPPAAGNIVGDILKELNSKKNVLPEQGLSDIYYQILNASQHAYIRSFRELIPWNASLETSGQLVSHQSFLQLKSAEVGSHLTTADSKGNILMISTSLNSSFGSYFLSPTTGILLSDFTRGMDSKLLFWSCPVLVKLNADDDDDDDDIVGVGAVGGSSVPLNIAQVIINRIYFEKSLKDATNGPFLHLVLGEDGVPWSPVSGVFNTSSLFESLSETEPEAGATSILLVQSHAEHVRAIGSPPQCCPSSGF
ncbi:glutathione hydrolase 6 [Microcaecilia unicolor]|uniref:Glutathione hydrolase 6 n=1 Tax=Microcaecilia unicolor TaxID=1415580 RepID=A0A6P7X5M5_9AMPH|nr:glutathione hydrolase 6 [Microcaecilia unicolor]